MEGTTGTAFRATTEQWQGLLGEYWDSGKSIRSFCRERGIPQSQMNYRLMQAHKANAEHGFIELVRETPCKLWVEAGQCRIRVERGFDAELLRQVAEALL